MPTTTDPTSPRQLLRERGLRATRWRQAVLQALLDAPAPLRASALLGRVSGLDRATLYRTLNRLVDVGLAHAIAEFGGARRYAARRSGRGSCGAVARFRCTECGLDMAVPDPALHLWVDLPGWSPAINRARVQVTLTGACPACLSAGAA